MEYETSLSEDDINKMPYSLFYGRYLLLKNTLEEQNKKIKEFEESHRTPKITMPKINTPKMAKPKLKI